MVVVVEVAVDGVAGLVRWRSRAIQDGDETQGPRLQIVCRRSSPSMSFVLATLRALHLDSSHVGDSIGTYEGMAVCAFSVVRVPIGSVAQQTVDGRW